MKKLLLLLLALLPSLAWADVEVNETNFPDVNFRSWVLSQMYGTDMVLTDDEIACINEIDVSEKGIRSLEGVEFFSALTYLYCSGNQLTALDLSKNTELYWMDCSGNQLTTLDVSKNSVLQYLVCDDNKLTALDVSKNTKLIGLSCSGNQLATLDLSQNTELGYLWCNGNQLTALDVSQDTLLIELYCNSNRLSALDVSKNMALEKLYCYGNQIKGTGMDVLVESLPTRFIGWLNVFFNENEQNEMSTTQVEVAKAKGWKPYYFDGENWQEYAGSAADGVEGITADDNVSGNIYNLAGQRSDGFHKGMNIVTGKKIFVK